MGGSSVRRAWHLPVANRHAFGRWFFGDRSTQLATRSTARKGDYVADQLAAKLATVTKRSPAFRFVDLFAGIGSFHAALAHAGGQCVYVSEIDEAARRTDARN